MVEDVNGNSVLRRQMDWAQGQQMCAAHQTARI